MLVEKVWAKVSGNYEYINGGLPNEAYEFLGGSPSIIYVISDPSNINNNGANAYTIIASAF